jgi:hypothetical protein
MIQKAQHSKHQNPTATVRSGSRRLPPHSVLHCVAFVPSAAMGCCLSSEASASGAVPAWRKRDRGGREGATAGGAFSSGGKKLPGGGGEMTEDELARVAGRMCANGSSAAACLHTQQGRKGTNQDAMVVWEVSL